MNNSGCLITKSYSTQVYDKNIDDIICVFAYDNVQYFKWKQVIGTGLYLH